MILFSIWKLGADAYCIPIHKQIIELTGEDILLGSIYMPLDRLIKKGFLESYLSESTPQRGGRHKRIYKVTAEGKEALSKVRELHGQMWDQAPQLLTGKN